MPSQSLSNHSNRPTVEEKAAETAVLREDQNQPSITTSSRRPRGRSIYEQQPPQLESVESKWDYHPDIHPAGSRDEFEEVGEKEDQYSQGSLSLEELFEVTPIKQPKDLLQMSLPELEKWLSEPFLPQDESVAKAKGVASAREGDEKPAEQPSANSDQHCGSPSVVKGQVDDTSTVQSSPKHLDEAATEGTPAESEIDLVSAGTESEPQADQLDFDTARIIISALLRGKVLDDPVVTQLDESASSEDLDEVAPPGSYQENIHAVADATALAFLDSSDLTQDQDVEASSVAVQTRAGSSTLNRTKRSRGEDDDLSSANKRNKLSSAEHQHQPSQPSPRNGTYSGAMSSGDSTELLPPPESAEEPSPQNSDSTVHGVVAVDMVDQNVAAAAPQPATTQVSGGQAVVPGPTQHVFPVATAPTGIAPVPDQMVLPPFQNLADRQSANDCRLCLRKLNISTTSEVSGMPVCWRHRQFIHFLNTYVKWSLTKYKNFEKHHHESLVKENVIHRVNGTFPIPHRMLDMCILADPKEMGKLPQDKLCLTLVWIETHKIGNVYRRPAHGFTFPGHDQYLYLFSAEKVLDTQNSTSLVPAGYSTWSVVGRQHGPSAVCAMTNVPKPGVNPFR